jgi:hypothetical protein
MTINGIQLMLQNPFYTGLMRYKSEIWEGTHEPILTKKLFDKVQETMRSRGKVHEKRRHQFHLLGLLKCASCGGAITAEKHTKPSGREYVYYRCTRKKGPCAEKHFVRAEILEQQILDYLRKVSLSSQDTEKVLAALDSDEERAKAEARTEAENLKAEIQTLDTKLEKLLNLYLVDALSTAEYAAKKNKLISEKATMSEKITDIEKKGVSWLEPAREFVLSLNQAAKLLEQDDFSETTAFLKTIGSNHVLRNRRFEFMPEWRVARAAERSAAASAGLHIPRWCRILEIARTGRAAEVAGGGAAHPASEMPNAAKPLRSKTTKESGENHRLSPFRGVRFAHSKSFGKKEFLGIQNPVFVSLQ